MTEHKIDDRVLVSGVVVEAADGQRPSVRIPGVSGALLVVDPAHLRPDTGRPITADDVRELHREATGLQIGGDEYGEFAAGRLNHIARGVVVRERGIESNRTTSRDEEPPDLCHCGRPEFLSDDPVFAQFDGTKMCRECIDARCDAYPGNCPAAPRTERASDEPAPVCSCKPCNSGGTGHPTIQHCAACCFGTLIAEYDPECPDGEHREMAARQFPPSTAVASAGSLPVPPLAVTEALTWLSGEDSDLTPLQDLLRDRAAARAHAATLVRWLISVTGDSAERAASERDEPRCARCGHSRVDHIGGDIGECLDKQCQPRCAAYEPRACAESVPGCTRLRSHTHTPIEVAPAASEQDERRDWVSGVGRHDPMSQPPDEWLDMGPYPGGGEGIKGPEDLAPRSWSLPAPPPDDVTVVHIPEMYELQGGPELYRADDEDGLWWGPDGALWEWSQMLGNGTVVEGEPPAPEPVFAVGDRVRVKSSGRTGVLREVDARGRHLIFGDNESWIVGVRADNLEPAPEPQAAEPPRFERGFYRLARDLDVRGDAVPADAEVIVHGPIGRGLLWVSQLYSSGDDVCGAISAAALAAAGAERVEER